MDHHLLLKLNNKKKLFFIIFLINYLFLNANVAYCLSVWPKITTTTTTTEGYSQRILGELNNLQISTEST